MLFTSYEFLLLFLPLFLCCWWIISLSARAYLPLLLLGASAVFYSLWGLGFLVLLVAMISLNYVFGLVIQSMPDDAPPHNSPDKAPTPRTTFWTRKKILVAALLCNLAPLCYFKYSTFILNNINILLGSNLHSGVTALPLGISFYTFIQIAWLITVYRRQIRTEGFTQYALFSSCFPYVISGPIVRYSQVGPQFAALDGIKAANVAPALSLFVMGLGKKVLLADSLAVYANSIFNAAEKGFPLTGAEAWAGSLAYTFQLYFDFSGYTDMALGIALLLGIRLPDNFDSPYKSTGVVDFWRRWHITLSSWLRDFLYIPLGGSRVGKLKQYRNLFLTMLLGGVWHGAGWPFVVWGAAHGAMLTINHFFKSWAAAHLHPRVLDNPFTRVGSIFCTFVCINAAWVVFRADSIHGASRIYEQMLHIFNESGGLWSNLFANHYIQDLQCPLLLALCALITWCLPNSREILFGKSARQGGGRAWLSWTPSRFWAWGLAVLSLASLIMLSRKSVFLYFQF
ncbi:MAG: MBOAT family protein [Desulfovibrionaceae bacterium]